MLILRFDEFGFRVENHNDLSKECFLADDIYEDPQHRYYLFNHYHYIIYIYTIYYRKIASIFNFMSCFCK